MIDYEVDSVLSADPEAPSTPASRIATGVEVTSLHADMAADGEPVRIRSGGQTWVVSWHPPPDPPQGIPHGAEGICVTPAGDIVLISPDGHVWDFPGGRPEPGETWLDTLRREMLEEACATVVSARLLGFTRGEAVTGPERGRALVRSVWRADVELGPWEPRFEIPHRRVVAAADVPAEFATHPFAPFIRRQLHEAVNA